MRTDGLVQDDSWFKQRTNHYDLPVPCAIKRDSLVPPSHLPKHIYVYENKQVYQPASHNIQNKMP